MGRKKKNTDPRSKQFPTTRGASVDVPSSTNTTDPTPVPDKASSLNQGRIEPVVLGESDALSYSTIKLECERALTTLRRGNHTKALRLLKELSSRNENSVHSALIHRVHGTICVKVASIIDDVNTKQRHLKNAIESARKAVELSPNSIEFSHFYANLLYEAANDAKEYEEVVQECERALVIENPIDPAKESLQDEKDQKIPTAEARIAHVQTELRQLIQKSNLYSMSSWMKNLGNGEEKFRLIPIRRVTEDPMEVRMVQARRANEIKKATKTPDERRKEIEVRVAAARLLQQKSEVNLMQTEDGKGDRTLDSSLVSGTRVGERRKHGNVRKQGSSLAERRGWVNALWTSMSIEGKKDLLKIKISDLKTHFSSSKDASVIEVISEALSFYDANKKWKFWLCCGCHMTFVDSETHIHHVVQEHLGNLLPKMQSILPQTVDNEWNEMLLNCSWKALDFSAAAQMLTDQTKCKDSELAEDNRSSLTERDLYEKITNNEFKSYHENQGSVAHSLSDSFPVSDDPERTMLLKKIHAVFELLIRPKYLSASHLNKVIQFTMDELQGLASGSQLLNQGLDQTPLCICFLGASQLRKILKFLQELSQSCGSDKSTDQIEDSKSDEQAVKVKERVVLNEDASLLLLNECLLSSDIPAATAQDVTANVVPSGADPFLSWIYAGPPSGEVLASWAQSKEEKAQQRTEIFQTLEKEFYHLQNLCERKCEHLNYEEALLAVVDLCLEEGKKREVMTKTYESVLRKRREELIEAENDVMFIGSRFELDAVTNILKEAEALNVNQFGYEETSASVPPQLCDLKSGEDENWRAKDYLHQVDTCIEFAIQRQKEQLSIEISKIDARIMRNVAGMQQLELKLEPLSALDYQSILLPLVVSYLKAHLEDLAEKHATKKSDAAREAFLAELALDSKKGGIKGGSDSSRNAHEKSKEKKRNKEFRKAKDSKVTSGPVQDVLHDEAVAVAVALAVAVTVDEDSVQVSKDGDTAEVDIAVSEDGDALRRLQEEEFRRKIELEADERKLEETLEYQRRIENEAKQKHLAELQKKSAHTNLENLTGFVPNVEVADEHFKPSEAGQLAESDLVTDLSRDGPATQNALSGVSNVGVIEHSVLPSEKRKGRRGRRHKISTKPVDGSQPSPSDKDNIPFDNQLNQQVRYHDNLLVDSVNPLSEDDRTKILRQHVEDEEERFQTDLNKAVRQSFDTFEEQQISSLITPPLISYGEVDTDGLPSNEPNVEIVQGADILGTGLKNEIGEYNCFLNVIIQSLWHLRRFREEFLRRSMTEHVHVGNPCVVCALYEILAALSMAAVDSRSEAVSPTSLRIALSNLYPDSNFFQEGQMNDASEVLAVIFNCLHQSLTPSSSVSDTESVESNCTSSWDCASDTCLVHSIFGMDIFEQMNCYSCGLESRHLKYTSFFHNINANSLRTMKVTCTESSFDELLNVVEMNHQLACDPDVGGCGKLNYIHHFLSAPPHVLTTVLGWQNNCESADDITATLAALSNEIDISVLYRGLDPENIHNLVSVVCYYGQHYHCFAYNHDKKCWIMYDDRTVKAIGSWADVLTMCEKGHLQPQVLFFEAVN